MNSFQICIRAILPIFLITAAGYAAKRVGLIREEDVPRINALAFKVFLPVMCFYNVYTSDLSSALRPGLMLFTVLAILAVYALSFAYAHFFVKERSKRSVIIQGLYRSNYVILGLPLAAGLTQNGDIGVAAVMGAVVVPIYNVLAVLVLELYNGTKPDGRKLLKNIATNGLIIGNVLGILVLILKLKLPSPVEIALRDMSRVASPLMLFLLGAFFRFRGMLSHWKDLIAVCLGRLVLIPALVLGLALVLGFRDLELITLLAIFASSTVVSSFTMAQQLGGDAPLAGDIVVATSALASFGLFGWSFLFKMLNFI